MELKVIEIVASAVAGGALVALVLFARDWWRRRAAVRFVAAELERAQAGGQMLTARAATAEDFAQVERRTEIPDRYCEKCNEPRGGTQCPLCGGKTIEIPPQVLAEEIEAHGPKGSEP